MRSVLKNTNYRREIEDRILAQRQVQPLRQEFYETFSRELVEMRWQRRLISRRTYDRWIAFIARTLGEVDDRNNPTPPVYFDERWIRELFYLAYHAHKSPRNMKENFLKDPRIL